MVPGHEVANEAKTRRHVRDLELLGACRCLGLQINGLPKHWIGVHPNAGYYEIDVEGIVAAYKHGLVFNKDDIDRLVATAIAERRYWTALVPFDGTIQKQFEDTLDPSSWGGLSEVPWYLANQLGKAP